MPDLLTQATGRKIESMPRNGYHTLTPRLVVSDLRGAVKFLCTVFDGSGDVERGRPAEIRVGDSLAMVAPAGERGLFPAFL
jgi:PhnB protein